MSMQFGGIGNSSSTLPMNPLAPADPPQYTECRQAKAGGSPLTIYSLPCPLTGSLGKVPPCARFAYIIGSARTVSDCSVASGDTYIQITYNGVTGWILLAGADTNGGATVATCPADACPAHGASNEYSSVWPAGVDGPRCF
jgi:hypothetical protein